MTVATRPSPLRLASPTQAPAGRLPARPARDRVTEYALEVVNTGMATSSAGTFAVGRLVRLACQRHLRDLETGRERGLRWDPELAEKSIDFFLFLHHFEGPQAGKPVVLEPWECFAIGSLDGWLRWDDELRIWRNRFTDAFNEIAKKNGKSLLAGGVGIKRTFFSGEAGAQGYAIATKRDQAKIVWGGADTMVAQSPHLRSRIKRRALSLFDPVTASFFKPLGADTKTEDGLNPNDVIVDEEHRAENRDLIDLMSQAFGARLNPLIYKITTAGLVGESIWAEDHDYAVKVLEGIVENDQLFALIFNLDDGDDPFDEAAWPKANPNLGVSVMWSDMRARAKEAKEQPGKRNAFLRLRLNVRVQSARAWMSPELWARGNEEPDPMATRLAYGGMDLGSRSDLAAFVAVAAAADDPEKLDVFCRFWLPRDAVAERVRRDRVPYDVWADKGFISLTEGDVTDYDQIRLDLGSLITDGERWAPEHVDDDAGRLELGTLDIYELGYDPHDATQLSTQLDADGFRLVRVMQSTTEMDAPVKEIERLLAAGKIRHGSNPVLAWMVSNTVMTQDAAGRRKPDKEKSREKIDGVPALVMAIKRWMANAGGEISWGPASDDDDAPGDDE